MILVDNALAERERMGRPIRVGRRTSEQLEVISGLAPGERVITSDYTGFDKVERIIFTN